MAPSPVSAVLPRARTPLYAWQTGRGARFIERAGWQLAATYAGVEPELAAARASLGAVDISAFPKISLVGSGLPALAQPWIGGSVASRPGGVAALDGTTPVLACRLTAHELLLLALTPGGEALNERRADLVREPSVIVTDITSGQAGFGLFGPRTPDLLRHVTAFSAGPEVLPEGFCAQTSLGGVHALLVRPPGVVLLSVYVYVAWDVAEYVWERLWEAGRAYGLTPVGLAAYQVLRQDRSTRTTAS